MNQRRLWSDPKVIAERRAKAEAFMGRKMELPGETPPPKVMSRGEADDARAAEAVARLAERVAASAGEAAE